METSNTAIMVSTDQTTSYNVQTEKLTVNPVSLFLWNLVNDATNVSTEKQTNAFQQDHGHQPPPSNVLTYVPTAEPTSTETSKIQATLTNTSLVTKGKLSDVLLVQEDYCSTRNGTHVYTKENSRPNNPTRTTLKLYILFYKKHIFFLPF